MAAVCEKEREGMPIVGLAKDRQVLRGLNGILPATQTKICFACAQINSQSSLWESMYEPAQRGKHVDVDARQTWSEHRCCAYSHNGIDMYTIRESLQCFFFRDERQFRLHFSLADFQARYCSDEQEDGNPFRSSELFTEEWVQDLQFVGVEQVDIWSKRKTNTSTASDQTQQHTNISTFQTTNDGETDSQTSNETNKTRKFK